MPSPLKNRWLAIFLLPALTSHRRFLRGPCVSASKVMVVSKAASQEEESKQAWTSMATM
jgi:hypothetical protein